MVYDPCRERHSASWELKIWKNKKKVRISPLEHTKYKKKQKNESIDHFNNNIFCNI